MTDFTTFNTEEKLRQICDHSSQGLVFFVFFKSVPFYYFFMFILHLICKLFVARSPTIMTTYIFYLNIVHATSLLYT